MKRLLCILLLLGSSLAAYGQKGSISAYSREELLQKIGVETAFVMPEFEDCHVYYTNGTSTVSKLNILAFDNSLRFISGSDTLKVSYTGNIDCILSEDRKFILRGGNFIEVLRETAEISLGERKRLTLGEPKQSGSYGTVPPSSSAKTTTTDDYRLGETRTYVQLVNVDWKVSWNYYLIDSEGNPVRASRKAFEEAFPELKAQIKDIIKANKFKLDNREELCYLFDFCINQSK